MSKVIMSIPISLELVNKLEQLAKENNIDLNDFIINILTKTTKKHTKNVKNTTDIINKYRNM